MEPKKFKDIRKLIKWAAGKDIEVGAKVMVVIPDEVRNPYADWRKSILSGYRRRDLETEVFTVTERRFNHMLEEDEVWVLTPSSGYIVPTIWLKRVYE